jgi:two-component system, OmpR family, response regulator
MAYSILVVDDDPHIRDVVRFAFEKTGMNISIATDGKEALRRFDRNVHDLIVLDVGMPEMDGLEVCRQIRKTAETPILFLSARDEEIDRILGLEIGGDDYVTKPFSPRELVARVNAILRRTRNPPPPVESKTLKHGELAIDADSRTANFEGKPVALTALEFSILRTLMARPGFVFTRELILDAAYAGNIHVADRTIDSHIRNIRAKMAAAGCESVIALRGISLTASNRSAATPTKWRPSLSLVVFLVLAERASAAAVQRIFPQGLSEPVDPGDRVRTDRSKRGTGRGVSSRSRIHDFA